MPTRTKTGQFKKGGNKPEIKQENDLIVDLDKLSDDVENDMGKVEKSVEKALALDIGVHLLVAAVIAAVLIIFIILPEFSHKPTLSASLDTLDADDFVLVPNSCIKNDTKVERLNRITGDRQSMKCQDRPQDDIVLATVSSIDGPIAIMTQGDAVPMHAELLDMAPWIPQSSARAKAEQLGYLVVV